VDEAGRSAAGVRVARHGHAEGDAALTTIRTLRKSDTGSGLLPALLSLHGVIVFWIAHGLAHSLLRLSMTRTLTLDDSRESELVQNFALGYQVRQPPLYEWLLWLSQQAFGTGIESHLVVRYSLIAALGVATFGAARAAIKDDRWAAVASLSLAFSYPVGWTFHEWATQTILLCIACMATLHSAIRFFESPALRTAVWLGLAIGLGLQAKYSYPLFLGALVIASATLPEARRRLSDPRLLISVLIALLMIAPFVGWIWQVQGNFTGEIAQHMIQDTRSHVVRALVGLWRLVRSIPAFLLPWLLIVVLLAPKAFLPARGQSSSPSMAERLTLRAMVIAALMAAVGIVAAGSTTVRVLYMHVVVFVAPVYVFARIARLTPDEEILRNFAIFAVATEIVLLAVRFIAATDNPITRRMDRGIAIDYEQIVDELTARGITSGTLIGVVVRDVGNIRASLPDLRIRAQDSFRTERPPRRLSDARSCVLIWRDGQENAARRIAAIDSIPVERIDPVSSPAGMILRREHRWFLARLDPRLPICS
jgi:hypothetical protein